MLSVPAYYQNERNNAFCTFILPEWEEQCFLYLHITRMSGTMLFTLTSLSSNTQLRASYTQTLWTSYYTLALSQECTNRKSKSSVNWEYKAPVWQWQNIKVNLFQAEFSSLSIPVDGIMRYKSGHQHYHHQFLFIKRVALKSIPLCINVSASPCADIISSTVAHSSVFLNWCAKSSSWVFTASSSKPIFSCGKDRAPQNNVIIFVRSQQILSCNN